MLKKVLIAAVLAAISTSAVAQVHVRGHFRKDGTYVQPHVRSSPNSSRADNWSSKGNVNPYTGQTGTVEPYRLPSYPVYRPYTAPSTPDLTPPISDPSKIQRPDRLRCNGYGC